MFKKAKSGLSALSDGQVTTIIGEGTEFSGILKAQGSLRVDGIVEGEVQAEGDLIVGAKGRIEARVRARNMKVAGNMHGDTVLHGAMEIEPGGRVLGDIDIVDLVVHEGGKYQGTCRMEKATNEVHGVESANAMPDSEASI